MQALSMRTIQTEAHPQTKGLFWYLFAGSRGGHTRIRIISQLRDIPSNKNQLSQDLGMDYKGIQHHMKVLEENNIVTKIGVSYSVTYFVSALFEEGEAVFDEIVTKLQK